MRTSRELIKRDHLKLKYCNTYASPYQEEVHLFHRAQHEGQLVLVFFGKCGVQKKPQSWIINVGNPNQSYRSYDHVWHVQSDEVLG